MSTHSPASSAADSAWLLKELTTARVLEPGQLGPVLDRFRAEVGSGDAATFAEFLVRDGLLTPFQAEQALTGDAHKLLLGPYLLQEPIGGGSMGTVFRAVSRSDRASYAIKVLPLRSLWNVHLAKKQVQTFAALPQHPAIVPFVAIDSSAGCHYLAWPFVDGEPLDRLVKRVGPLAPADAVRIMSEVADGLAVCHSGGIVHGLLKPSNLVLASDRRPRILDLGIGAILSENLTDDETMFDTISTAHTAIGMMDCAAPETLAHPTLRTPLGDEYSFGCVLYFLLTGVFPFPDGNAVDKIIGHQTREPISIRERNPQVPESLTTIVARLMQKHASDRPGDLRAIRDELRNAVPTFDRTQTPPYIEPPKSAPVVELVPVPPPLPAPHPFAPTPAKVSPFGLGNHPTPWKPPTLRSQSLERGEDAIDFDLPEEEEEVPLTPARPSPGVPDSPSAPTHPFERKPPTAGIRGPKPAAAPTPAVSAPTPIAAKSSTKPRVPRPPVPIPPTPEFRLARPAWRFLRIVWPWTAPRTVVQFSVYGPARVNAGRVLVVQVFAHSPGELLGVSALARSGHPDAELLATGFADRMIALEQTVRISVAMTDIPFAIGECDLAWVGESRPSEFQITVPEKTPAGQHAGQVTMTIGRIELLALRFQVGVRQRA